MNIHSCPLPLPGALDSPSRIDRTDKRDALLRAAIDTFAARGFFNAQVADVARAAGVAAGTVYLYFRGKDDLLISIFERTMKEAIADGRKSVDGLTDPVERLREIARSHLGRLGRDRALAVVFQVELRQSTKFMERFSSTQLREYLGIIRDVIADGQARQVFRTPISPTLAAKLFFGALDEMATNWILSRRKYSLVAEADAIVDLFVGGLAQRSTVAGARGHAGSTRIRAVAVLGAGTMGAQIAAHVANAGVPVLLLDVTRDAARDGLRRAAGAQAGSVLHARTSRRSFAPAASTTTLRGIASADWIIEAVVERLDVKQALFERVDRLRAPHAIVSSNTSGIPIAAIVEGRSPAFRAHCARHALLQSAALPAAGRDHPDAGHRSGGRRAIVEFADRRLGKGVVVAKDTPNFIANHIGLFGVMQIFKAWASIRRGATRSRKSTR